ncbi:MAG: hypothetical protein AAF525_01910 [Pseudomonadota bacterium]
MKLIAVSMLLFVSTGLVAATPPRYDCNQVPEHRQFDFWLGDWEVVDRDGNLAGRNTISRNEHGCLLLERWRGTSGPEGQSVNFYDPELAQWRQIWVSGGNRIDIAGEWVDGSMTMTGTIYYFSNGVKAPFRGRWTPIKDGRVRQFFEQQARSGEWRPWFEGFYTTIAR